MKTDKIDYMMALAKAYKDEEAYHMIESLINDHFAMLEHMEKTSLYDVYMYEEKITKNTLEPMEILVYENEKLKKEVNELRRQLGKIEKYKE